MVSWNWISRTAAGGSAQTMTRTPSTRRLLRHWLILRTGGRDLFACFEDWVIRYGMPHHVIICQGHHKASLVKFAVARGVRIV